MVFEIKLNLSANYMQLRARGRERNYLYYSKAIKLEDFLKDVKIFKSLSNVLHKSLSTDLFSSMEERTPNDLSKSIMFLIPKKYIL